MVVIKQLENKKTLVERERERDRNQRRKFKDLFFWDSDQVPIRRSPWFDDFCLLYHKYKNRSFYKLLITRHPMSARGYRYGFILIYLLYDDVLTDRLMIYTSFF